MYIGARYSLLIGIEKPVQYCKLAHKRIAAGGGNLPYSGGIIVHRQSAAEVLHDADRSDPFMQERLRRFTEGE